MFYQIATDKCKCVAINMKVLSFHVKLFVFSTLPNEFEFKMDTFGVKDRSDIFDAIFFTNNNNNTLYCTHKEIKISGSWIK